MCNLTLSKGLLSIGEGAFRDCGGVTEIELPMGLTEIGAGAFENCTGLTEVKLPYQVTVIPDRIFAGCRGLLKVTMAHCVTSIGADAFRDCEALTELRLPAKVQVGAHAFDGCGAKLYLGNRSIEDLYKVLVTRLFLYGEIAKAPAAVLKMYADESERE
jgi:hypothetical protein